MTTNTTIQRATEKDLRNVTNALASAFAYDPLFQWVIGVDLDRSIEPKLKILFGAMVKVELSRSNDTVFTTGDDAGAAIWKHPNDWKMSVGDMLRVLPAMLRSLGTRTPRMIGALSASEKVHPTEEHYFLEAIGTHQDMQGKGVGSELIRDMLDRCDIEGVPAYLESSNPRNVPFYARHGFEVTGEIDIGKGAPTVTAMWRNPR
jgi:ribosomal protein S18 acetylase RimI-like enzyme